MIELFARIVQILQGDLLKGGEHFIPDQRQHIAFEQGRVHAGILMDMVEYFDRVGGQLIDMKNVDIPVWSSK